MTKQDFIAVFRDAGWLTRERVLLWAQSFAIAWVLFVLWDIWAHSTLGITDAKGEHIGRDFIDFWTNALLVVQGRAKLSYDLKAFYEFHQALAGTASEPKLYSYPPVAMLLTLPLAFLPFLAAYVFWTIAGCGICANMMSRYVPWRMALVVAIAAPACFLNLLGQNGYFTGALLAGGLILLDRKPVVAGILLGLLCYKPQLGLLLPIALASGGYWRSFVSAAVTVILLVLISTLTLGADIWAAFIAQMGRQSIFLEHGDGLWHRMPTVFCALRLMGASLPFAYFAQALSSLVAIAFVFRVWRGKSSLGIKSAVLVLAIFMATPYAWDYDMVILVFALLWVAADARLSGWRPWEKFAWLMLILLPLHMPLAKMVGVQWGAAVTGVVLWLTLRRAGALK